MRSSSAPTTPPRRCGQKADAFLRPVWETLTAEAQGCSRPTWPTLNAGPVRQDHARYTKAAGHAERHRGPQDSGGSHLSRASVDGARLRLGQLSVRDVSKSYGAAEVLTRQSLEVADREFVALLGPSGCGKSTSVADHQWPGAGGYRAGDAERGRISPANPAPAAAWCSRGSTLFPWRSALGNVEFGLQVTGVPKRERRQRARDYLSRVGLAGFEDAWPHQLSGRHAAAGRHRARLLHPAQPAVDGRAVWRAGRADPRRVAGRVAGDLGSRAEDGACSSPTASRRRSTSPTASWCSAAARRGCCGKSSVPFDRPQARGR